VAIGKRSKPHVKAFPYSLNRPSIFTTPTINSANASGLAVNNPLPPAYRAAVRNADSFIQRICQLTCVRTSITRHIHPPPRGSLPFSTAAIGKPQAPMAQSREPKVRPKAAFAQQTEGAGEWRWSGSRALEQAAVLHLLR